MTNLMGTTGDDALDGTSGNETLDGGPGNDTLQGGGGDDVYAFGVGDGHDLIALRFDDNPARLETLQFKAGILPAQLTGRADGSDLVLSVSATDSVRLQWFFLYDDPANAFNPVQRVQFSDGTTWGLAQLAALALRSTAGDDLLHGTVQAETLDGGAGDDTLYGGGGDDVYAFGVGDGHDLIALRFDDNPARLETLQFKAGVLPAQLTGRADGSDLVLSVSATDSVRIQWFFLHDDPANAFNPVQRVQFSDGTTWGLAQLAALALQSTAGDDLLNGTVQAETLDGGAGDDTLYGGGGDDVYAFGVGDGHDLIALRFDDNPGRLQTLYFKAGILPAQVTGRVDGHDLVLSISATDSVQIQWFYLDDHPANAYNPIQQVQFSDGTTWGLAQLAALGRGMTGTPADDDLTGTSGADLLIGGAGNDTLRGGLGDDRYEVDATGDVVVERAEEGTDLIESSVSFTASDHVEHITLTGSASIDATGNDLANVLTGNSGANRFTGGAGDDTCVFSRGGGQDTISAEADARATRLETLVFAAGILPGEVTARLVGTSLELSITGTTDKVTIEGFYLDNRSTNPLNPIQQVVFAGPGVTWDLAMLTRLVTAITGTTGHDLLTGTARADQLIGLAGNDTLSGLAGHDTLDGGAGTDKMNGGAGDDTYVVDVAGDVVTELAGEGTDLVQSSLSWKLGASVEHLTLTGTAALTGTGNELANRLTGNAGANVLNGLAGADTMLGGAGNDTYVVDSTGDVVTELAGEGTDLVQSALSWTLSDHVENLTLTGTVPAGVWRTATGNALANVLTGSSGMDILDGLTGADTLLGGLGNDTYWVDQAGDVVTELASQGTDQVRSTISYTLGNNVESLELHGDARRGTGNALANSLTGNQWDNTLDGGAGTDKMSGGAGDDTYVVDVAGDVVTELAGEGTDLVQSSLSWKLGASVEHLTLTGTAALTGTGNELANRLTGNAGANVLNGLAGADTMLGGAGNDTYVVDSAGDVITELTGEGTDLVQSSTSHTLSDHVENLTLTGTVPAGAWRTATGNALANVLTGSSGMDILDGLSGADTLLGGLGNDAYWVDQAGDVVTELANQGTDKVRSIVNYTLGANVEYLELHGDARIGTGNTLDNEIIGSRGADVLTGLAGNDSFGDGYGGDEVNPFADTMIGGLGNDRYVVHGNDVIVELASQGTDTAQSWDSFTLADNIENLTLMGLSYQASHINGTGNTLANALTGNQWNNTLDGGAGHDTLTGGVGVDVLKGGAGSDLFVFAAGDSVLSLSGTGGAGALTGFDTLTDFSLGYRTGAQDKIDTVGSPTVVANTARLDGTDSTLTLAGQTLKSHAIVKGMVTFDDADTYASALGLTSMSDVAAAVQYLQSNDLGNAGASVAFDATTGGIVHTFLFTQGDNAGTNTLDVLVDLLGVNANGLMTSSSAVPSDFIVIG